MGTITGSHYDIRVKIDSRTGHLSAHVDLAYRAQKKAMCAEFLLFRGFLVTEVGGEDVRGYRIVPQTTYIYAPDAATISVDLRRPVEKGEVTRISLSYAGTLNVIKWQVNRITEGWVELSSYAPWFPFDPLMRDFTYAVSVTEANGHEVVGNGNTSRSGDVWIVSEEVGCGDIALFSAPSLLRTSLADGVNRVDVVFTTPSLGQEASNIAELTAGAMGYYYRLLGESSSGKRVLVVLAPRTAGGGYGRKGLVVLTCDVRFEVDSPGDLSYLAHEVAHLWWTGAPSDTWEDWLNESFAEYFALMSVRERLGEEPFTALLEAKRQKSQGLPAIIGIERSADAAYDVLYNKGCVYLHDLCVRIGEPAFIELSRNLARRREKSTRLLLDLLSSTSGEDVSQWFQGLLRT